MSKTTDGSKSMMDLALSRRRVIKTAGVLAAGVAAPSLLSVNSAFAAYPERPVKIIVANSPGGPSDLVGRMVAAAIQQSTGKTFVIENIGGAGGIVRAGCFFVASGGGGAGWAAGAGGAAGCFAAAAAFPTAVSGVRGA